MDSGNQSEILYHEGGGKKDTSRASFFSMKQAEKQGQGRVGLATSPLVSFPSSHGTWGSSENPSEKSSWDARHMSSAGDPQCRNRKPGEKIGTLAPERYQSGSKGEMNASFLPVSRRKLGQDAPGTPEAM